MPTTYTASVADGTDPTMEPGICIQQFQAGSYTGEDFYVGVEDGLAAEDGDTDAATHALQAAGWQFAGTPSSGEYGWVYSGNQYCARVEPALLRPSGTGVTTTTLDMAGVARHLGLAVNTIYTYRADHRLPEPDGIAGQSPWWLVSTIDTWQANRPGQGAGGGRPTKKTR